MPSILTDVNWVSASEDQNVVATRTEVVGTARFDWGDGTIEAIPDRGDEDRDGVTDPIFPYHTYAADGVYDVSVRADGGGPAIHLRAFTFAGAAEDLVLAGSKLRDAFIGGAGDDRIEARAGEDYLTGGDGNDTLTGGKGNDQLVGGDGDDLLRGGEGNDDLIGYTGNDDLRGEGGGGYLSGGEGDDTVSAGTGTAGAYILGDDGDDVLLGGAGHDHVTGGTGHDVMTGGAASDMFWFGSLADGAVGRDRDIITDFDSTSGVDEDFIHLAGIGHLTFVTGRFHADGTGEVRAVDRGDRTIVQVDADGNGTVDMQVALLGPQSLDSSNFIL